MIRCSYKHRHFKNTKLLAGNDHMIDIFTSELRYGKYLTVYFQCHTVCYIIRADIRRVFRPIRLQKAHIRWMTILYISSVRPKQLYFNRKWKCDVQPRLSMTVSKLHEDDLCKN